MTRDWSKVLLGLLNTTPVVDGKETDLLGDDAAARSWLRANGGGGADVATVRRLRDQLQGVVRADVDARVLASHLVTVRQEPVIDDHGLTWELAGTVDWCARVVLAWGDLETSRPGRLRACANGECHLFLIDRSRGGTGRWCSMSGCGNRMKARRHYGRTVETTPNAISPNRPN